MKVPNHIVHYSRGKPFQSITSVPLNQVYSVINSLDETNSWGLNRFSDLNYLNQRFDVESKMRAKFIELGGEPVLKHPIYFFLGRNPRFEENLLNVGYLIELSNVDKKAISFSYGDTMLSFNEENPKLAGDKYANPLCNKLFLLDELQDLATNKLYPENSPLSIEAHLWIQPLKAIVKKLVR